MSDHALATASSAINLSKSLIDFVPASGTLINFSQEIYKWLIREGIDEGSFEACRELARGLAYPNALGLDIRKQIEEADRKVGRKIKLPLPLVLSGSLGRLLASNPETCYMVSTVAALTQCHAPGHAADVLCSMILDRGDHSNGVSYKHEVQRSPIKAVISKIVESIYLNVINVGHRVTELPPELAGLHKHILDDRVFAGIVMGIQRSKESVIVRSDTFLADLAIWLLTHFHGKLEVVLKRRVIYERQLGGEDQSVRMMIEQECTEHRRCNQQNVVDAMVSVAGGLTTFLQGVSAKHTVQISYERQALYEVGESVQNEAWLTWQDLHREEMLQCKHVARELMIWLLALPISAGFKGEGLSFTVDEGKGEQSSALILGDLMKRNPRLINMPTCILDETGFTFNPKELGPKGIYVSMDSDNFSDGERPLKSLPAEQALEMFPSVNLLLTHIGHRCGCRECRKLQNLKQYGITGLDQCKPGCRRHAAFMLVSTLLCHGICDAFGLTDVSGRADVRSQADAVIAILSHIIVGRTVRWDTWFAAVVCTAAAGPGVSWTILNQRDQQVGDGSSSWAAMQHGSYVLAAPWVDIARKADVKGCFAVTAMEGNIRSVADNVAFIELEAAYLNSPLVEGAEGTISGAEVSGNHRDKVDWITAVSDTMEVETLHSMTSTAIFSLGDHFYRLMTTIRAGRSIRIVDPSLVLTGRSRARVTTCNHAPDSQRSCAKLVQVHEFDTILERWHTVHHQDLIYASRAIDCNAKINAILGLPDRDVVVRPVDQCCLACAVDAISNIWQDPLYLPYLLNVASVSTRAQDSTQRQVVRV